MRTSEVVLDTNVLVLFVVGTVSPVHIRRHKRTREFDSDAYASLVSFMEPFRRIITTGQILTEASNLLRQCMEPLAGDLTRGLSTLIKRSSETTKPAIEIVSHPAYSRLGLADAGLLMIDRPDAVLLTDDNALYIASVSAGRATVNFAHLRGAA